MGRNSFYITTPIYYVNDQPHIGHAYTTVLADILTRCHRLLGESSFFLTGTDEHGQKVQEAAARNGVSPQEQADRTVVRFQALWEKLEITHDDFIRTTEPRHRQVVQAILQDLFDRDLIYRGEFTGHYCVACERYFPVKDLIDGKFCPEPGCGKETREISEANYFFRMSRYQDWLIEHIKTHPEFIQPDFRANETLGFLRQPLGDLCVSRPKTRLAWGIELPFDRDYVCYVWFDALINYISAVGYRSDEAKFAQWWPATCHLIGKDILTTHTVYWPTMLKAMGLEPPRTVFAHGWWLIGDRKMGKSLGNVVNPMDMAEKYGVDAFRYFLAAEMSLGQDATFTEEAFVARYNSDLANDLGNLSSRVLKFLARNGGVIPEPGPATPAEDELRGHALAAVAGMRTAVAAMHLERGIEHAINAVRAANRYLEQTAPWHLLKAGDTARFNTVLHAAAETLRIVSGLLHPVMPGKMCELRTHLGLGEAADHVDIAGLSQWGGLTVGAAIRDPDPLFPRIQAEKTEASPAPAPKKDKTMTEPAAAAPAPAPVAENVITIDEFFRAQLRTATVLAAEKVEGADKLLKLRISLGGSEERTIVAGIAKFYAPEALVGRTVVVVANLKPAKIRGIESRGMLLAAKDGDTLRLVGVDGNAPPGCSVG
jgi:methionyl-tRNA synthetase